MIRHWLCYLRPLCAEKQHNNIQPVSSMAPRAVAACLLKAYVSDNTPSPEQETVITTRMRARR